MASFLISDCLIYVFSNLIEHPSFDTSTDISTKDLYSCTLVSRHWCNISTPLLYAYPFHHLRNSRTCYYQLIRTLLSCIPQSEIEKICIIKLTERILPPTFNYVSFIRGLIFDEMMLEWKTVHNSKEIWLSAYNPKRLSENSTTRIMDYLIKFICKHCNNLTTIGFPFKMKNDDIIKLLTLKNRNGKSKLSDLKELYYVDIGNEIGPSSKDIHYLINKRNTRNTELNSDFDHFANRYKEVASSLYLALSDSVCNLNLLYNEEMNSIDQGNSLSKFISSQKKLRHIILSERDEISTRWAAILDNYGITFDHNYGVVFNSLLTQSENLRILEFRNLSLIRMNETTLNSLFLINNIRELKLFKCNINDCLNPWAKNLTRIEVFEIVIDRYSTISKKFLIQLFQSSSSTLTKLIINDDKETKDFISLFRQIPLYLHSLNYLVLPKIFPSDLISIFESCTKLVHLNVILLDDPLSKLDNGLSDENLGKSVPKTLKSAHFKVDSTMSSRGSLRRFLEGYAKSGGMLKYLKIGYNDLTEFNDVTEQFGIRIIEYSPWFKNMYNYYDVYY